MGRNAKRKREARELKKQQDVQEQEKRLQVKTEKMEGVRHIGVSPQKVAQRNQVIPPGLNIASGEAIVEHIKGKKVIAFLQEVMDCCSEKCILEYTPYFQGEKYACLLIPRPNFTDILKYLCSYVVLFRLGNTNASSDDIKKLLVYIQHIRNLGIRVVYYADDLIFWSNDNAPLMLIQASDAIIVSNEILKNVLIQRAKISKPITVVPTHIDLVKFDSRPAIPPVSLSNRFKVLLTSGGRIGTNHAYEICELANEDPELARDVEWVFNCQGVAQLRSIINKFRNLKKTYIDWLSSDQYYSLVKSVDLIIHPANPLDLAYMCPPDMQQLWLDSKSEVKYTLAGAAKIPIISSPVYSYRSAISDGETGFLAETAQDFIDKIRLLKNDRVLAKQIGLAARKDIEQNYNISKRYPQYRDAIIGKVEPSVIKFDILPSIPATKDNSVFIPVITGGPRSFYENLKRWLPRITNDKWKVIDNINDASVAIAIAFVFADEIIAEKKRRSDLKIVYRLDGLPMNFEGGLEPLNLAKMQEIFQYTDTIVWQSKHCLNMWKEQNLIPSEINPEGPIIHNGVDLELFTHEGPHYGLPDAKKYNFLNLNWSTFKHKRLDLLQEVIKSYENNPDIKFYLIGNYVSTSQIANVNFWKGFSNVLYLGQMKNQSIEAKKVLASIYRSAMALLFTSEMEGSPNTALEAMGCGCPIIYNAKSDIIPEVLGTSCLPLEDLEKIFDPKIRDILVQETISKAQDYSVENCCRKYLSIFTQQGGII